MNIILKLSLCQQQICKSVNKHLKKILHDCLVFAANMASNKSKQRSGANYGNVVLPATALFNKGQISPVAD